MTATYIIGSEKLPIEIKSIPLPEPVTLISDLEVAAGQTVTAVSSYTIKDASAFYIGVAINDMVTPEVSIDILPIIDGLASTTSGVVRIMDKVVLNNRRGISEKYEMKTNTFRISITNHSDSSRIFKLLMYKSNSNGSQVKSSSSVIEKMEYYGKTLSKRPSPSAVPVGAIYMAIDTQELWQSNGSEWKVL